MSLEARNITFSVDGNVLLHGVDLAVARGAITALLGPSGAGKSTLLRILAGLDRPDTGTVLQDDRPVNTPEATVPPHRRRLAMIFQSLALWPHMTILDHLDFVMDRSRFPDKRERRDRARALLEIMGLPTGKKIYPDRLSGGERQRLAIARALAQEPEYLLMDEPFSSLDDLLRDEMLALTKTLRDDRRIGIVYVTHSIGEALSLADDIVAIKKGKVTAQWRGPEVQWCTRQDILACFR